MPKTNEKKLAEVKLWRKNNPDKVKAYNKRWLDKNPEWSKEYRKRYYLKNKSEILEKRRRWLKEDRELHPEKYRKHELKRKDNPKRIAWRKKYQTNLSEEQKEKNRVRSRLWYANNKGRAKKRIQEYNKKNAEKCRVWVKNKRARRKNAEGSFTEAEWSLLKERCDYKCQICGEQEPDIKLTVDHIIPLTKGGTNWISNIQPLCVSCNSKKNNKL